MTTIVIIIMVIVQVFLTVGALTLWNTTKKNSPQQLPKLFFVVSAARLLVSLIAFAAGLYLIHEDLTQVKIFTVVTLLLYMLLLVFDTAFFYFSSNTQNKN